MKICVIVGHSILKNGNITSATSSFCNEYNYNKELAKEIKKIGDKTKHQFDVVTCPERQFNKAREEKQFKLNKINGKKYDIVIELHLNASENKNATGTEVLYVSEKGKVIAQRIYNKLNGILNRKRGIKKRDDLYILTQTDAPAVLLELFFVTNINDFKTMEKTGMEQIAKYIVEGLINENIKEDIKENKTLYRIRKEWTDVKSQIGAYRNLNNAILNCKENYKVFDEQGQIIYKK